MHILLISIFIVLIYFQISSSYGVEREVQNETTSFVKILERYWQWWSNSPEDNPDNDPKCSIHIDTNNSFIFLQNAFETGNTNLDCTENPIPQGYSILIPLITSFCSQGDVGLPNTSYEEILNCALNLDRGIVKGNVFLDGKEIVDIFIDNGNGIDMEKNKKIINNLPQTYYKEILSKEFIDILVTNKTTLKNNWATQEYNIHPVYYNGIVHCDCIIINTNEFSTGDHTLEYIVYAKAEPPSPTLPVDKWEFKSTTTYKLTIQ
jgi:hypothetical protein